MKRHYQLDLNGLRLPTFYPEVLNSLIEKATRLPGNDEAGEGGYLAMKSKITGILTTIPAGYVEDEKLEGRCKNATIKVLMIIKHKVKRSILIRNSDLEIYGGGADLEEDVGAFSGFTNEYVDEAVLVVYGTYHRLMNSNMFEKDPETLPDELIQQVTEWQNEFATDNRFIIALAEAQFKA